MNARRILVVGAGITGASAARTVANYGGVSVDVIERAPQVSGNVFDPIHESGLRFHMHGPHAFHTNSKEVFTFLSRFTTWRHYEHRVRAAVDGLLVPVPFNFTSLLLLAPKQAHQWIQALQTRYAVDEHVPVLKLMNANDAIEREIGQLAYETIFRHYTQKQWELTPEELSPAVTARVPVRMGFDDRYFRDVYQGVPSPGYFEMVKCMLEHPQIRVFECTQAEDSSFADYDRVIFTGAVDEICKFDLGHLPYRSLTFEFETLEVETYQPCAQINFTMSRPWTRITEFKHMTGEISSLSLIGREFSVPHVPGKNSPYYPIPRDSERDLHKEYRELVSSRFPNVELAGRLADYRYLNMDQAVARGMNVGSAVAKDLVS